MKELRHQTLPSQLREVAVNVVDNGPTGGEGDTCRGLQHPQKLMGLIFYPGDVALAKKHVFQIWLEISGRDHKKPTFTVRIIMNQARSLPDFGINRLHNTINRRQHGGFIALPGQGQSAAVSW